MYLFIFWITRIIAALCILAIASMTYTNMKSGSKGIF
jgi:hypothetical protein